MTCFAFLLSGAADFKEVRQADLTKMTSHVDTLNATGSTFDDLQRQPINIAPPKSLAKRKHQARRKGGKGMDE